VNAFDTQPPRVRFEVQGNRVYARVHDYIGPSHIHDFTKVVVRIGSTEVPMKWYGEQLWYVELSATGQGAVVCATDRAANERCTGTPGTSNDAGPGDDAGTNSGTPDGDGGCCDTRRDPRGSMLLGFGIAVLLRRRVRADRPRA